MALLERADTGRKVTWVSLLGLVLIPVLITAGFILATWKATDRLDTVKAAIVNNDKGTTIDGQLVPLGRQLAAGLVDREDENLNWVLSDDQDADKGLAEGTYAAVVTIPAGFSEAVTSTGSQDPMAAHQTTLDIRTSRVSPLADSSIGQTIAQTAATTFNTEMTKTYLKNIYLGFNDMADQMRTMGEAADQLDQGAQGLETGSGEAARGATGLNRGLDQLSRNSGQLRSGAAGLADGASGLSKGAGELSTGASGLASGAGDLSTGLGKLEKGTKNLPKQTKQLANGAGELSTGVNTYTRSIDEIVKGLSGVDLGDNTGSLDDLSSGAQDLTDSVDRLSAGASGVSDGIVEYQQGLDTQAAKLQALADSGTPDLNKLVSAGLMDEDQVESVETALCTQGTDCTAAKTAYIKGVAGAAAGSLTGASAGLDKKDPKTGQSLKSSAAAVASGADQLSQGVTKLVDGVKDAVKKLEQGMAELKKNAPKLLGASKSLRDGASQVADGNKQLADGMPALAKGVAQSADGADKLAGGAKKLSGGASELAGGANKLATGAEEYSAGVQKYTGGVDQAASGSAQLVDGLDQLAAGSTKLADGTAKFSTGIKDGAEKVPSYTAPERDQLSTVAATPISNKVSSFSSLLQGSTMALLIMMALWIGALVTYTVVRAVSAKALTSRRSSWSVMGRGLLPGLAVSLVQAVILALLAAGFLHLTALASFDLLVLALVAGIVFTVVNFALVAWFGGVGRFISVLLVVLAVAGRVVGFVPDFFHGIAPFLPLTPALNGVTAITAGTPGLAAAYGGLLGWLILGLGAAVIAVARKRSAGFGELMKLARA